MLNKDFNLATIIRRVPNLDMITSEEEIGLKKAKVQADELRWKVKLELE